MHNEQTLAQKIASVENRISMLETKQMSIKILMNSLYGAMGNKHFRYFDIQMAEAVSITGKFVLQYIERGINRYLNKMLKTEGVRFVVAGDTDSIYVCFDRLVNLVLTEDQKKDNKYIARFLGKFCAAKVEPEIARLCAEIGDYLNCRSNTLVMKREVIASKGIWVAKKKYVLNVLEKEGVSYDVPKLKMVGVEAIKSSTPSAFREKITSAIKIVMNGTEAELIDFVRALRTEVKSMDPSEIAFPRGVSSVSKYDVPSGFAKGTPIHCRASIVYNRELDRLGLTKKYEKIRDGDKIKFIYLVMPNPTFSNVIAFQNFLPAEFKMERYIDHQQQFDSGFLTPLQIITNTIGWETKKTNSLDAFLIG